MRGALALAAAIAAGAAVWLATPGVALAQPCGLPDVAPTWFDFADGSVTFRDELAKPGVIVATKIGRAHV